MSHTYTPGPWKGKGKNKKWLKCDEWSVDNENSSYVTSVPIHKDRRVIAFVVSTDWDDGGVELNANARLISAAPELLSACLWMLDCMKAAGWEEDAACDAARAAITKATGGSNA